MYAYLAGISKRQKCPAIIIGGADDHVHVLSRMDREITVPKLVQELKRSSSAWMKLQGGQYTLFSWQSGYGAFSIHESLIDPTRKYIAEQEEHHRTVTFQQEYLRILKKINVEFDPVLYGSDFVQSLRAWISILVMQARTLVRSSLAWIVFHLRWIEFISFIAWRHF